MAVTLAASAIVVLGGCSASGQADGTPPAQTPVKRVATIYLNAAHESDCALTAALTLPSTFNWCNDPKLLSYKSVGAAYPAPQSSHGRIGECVDFMMDTHGSSDGSMPTGWQPWTLCFDDTRAGWRLSDQGQG